MSTTHAIEIMAAFLAGKPVELRWLTEPDRGRGWILVSRVNPVWNFLDAEYRIRE